MRITIILKDGTKEEYSCDGYKTENNVLSVMLDRDYRIKHYPLETIKHYETETDRRW